MNQGTIEIIVSPTGEIRLTTSGFAGEICRDASRAFEAALGLVLKDTPTAEAFSQNHTSVAQGF